MKYFLYLLAVILSSPSPTRGLFGQTKLLNITSGNESFLVKGSLGAPLTSIFCWKGKPATLGRFWESLLIEIDAARENYIVHLDRNVEIVEEAAALDAVLWFQSSASQVLGDRLYISPFKEACIAVTTSETYRIICHLLHVDTSLLLMSLLGLTLYANSRYLARQRPVSLISSHLLNMMFPWALRLPLVLRPLALATGLYVLYTSYQTGTILSPLAWGEFKTSPRSPGLITDCDCDISRIFLSLAGRLCAHDWQKINQVGSFVSEDLRPGPGLEVQL